MTTPNTTTTDGGPAPFDETAYKELLHWICDHPMTFSLLYDLDRLPEQVERNTKEWREMILITMHMKCAVEEAARQKGAQ